MNKFLSEYGRLVVTILGVTAALTLIGMTLHNKDRSIFAKYEENKNDTEILQEHYAEVSGDIIEQDTVPYFKIADGEGRTLEDPENTIDFTIQSDALTYNNAFQYISAIFQNTDITHQASIDGKKVTVTALAYKYTPVVETNTGDKNGHVVMEETVATDQYGHELTDKNGNTITVMQPKYKIEKAVLGKDTYIDTSEDDCRLKIVYRVQVGSYKAECEAWYIKNQASTQNVSVSGLQKAIFEMVE